MRLKVGTILEPKFDRNVEHAVVVGTTEVWVGGMETAIHTYKIRTVKSNNEAELTPKELLNYYEPIGQEEVGLTLFGGKS